MASYTTTEFSAWTPRVWEPGVEVASYNEAMLWRLARKLKAVGGQVNVRKFANLPRQVLADGSRGAGLTPSANTEVAVQGSPKTIYVYTAINDNAKARIMFDPEDDFKRSIEAALGEGVDIELANLATDFVSNAVGNINADIEEATFRVLVKKLAKAAKERFKIGKTEPAFVLAADQIDKVMGDPMFTQYQLRGGDSSPLVSGWVLRAHGAAFYESGTIQQTADTFRNMLVLPGVSIAIGFNQQIKLKVQDFEMEERLIGWCDVSALTVWEEYSGRYDTSIN